MASESRVTRLAANRPVLMHAYTFFSVHEELFGRIVDGLRAHGVNRFSGFVWSEHQRDALDRMNVPCDPLLVYTRDLAPLQDGKPPDLQWLRKRERELGISLQRMIASERHLLKGRTHDQILRMVEIALREIAATFDRAKPDFVFTEDISCLHSYLHFALAEERGIKTWIITTARMPGYVSVYSSGLQRFERVSTKFAELQQRGLSDDERRAAQDYVTRFRERPIRQSGMNTRAKRVGIDRADIEIFKQVLVRTRGDQGNPTRIGPVEAIDRRLRRFVRLQVSDWRHSFEPPVPGEKYVLYPLHFQPEATTLVQAPMYLDQINLLRDIAKSLPIDHRLYVKEHVSSRGRRPVGYYEEIKAIPSVRLLGPDEDTWTLIRDASVIAVITGTVGLEGLLFDKPVVTFGEVFFNMVPTVFRAGTVAKDDWYRLFDEAVTSYRPDPEAVLRLISAIQQVSFPGFVGNPTTFPEALEPANIEKLVHALATAMGL